MQKRQNEMSLPFISIYDTTLRDGSQGAGISFSISDKIRIARALDAFGISYIEGGWPSSNPKDLAFFNAMREEPLSRARLVAFGSTCHPSHEPEEDLNLKGLIEAGTPSVAIFGKTSLLHVREVLKISPEKNLRLIADSVRYLAAAGREVLFDGEHFFDGYMNDPVYAMEALQAAWENGATTLVLCDTCGGTLTFDLHRICTAVRKAVPENIGLGIHCHNDSDCAVAGSLMAVRAGCNQVQGSLNGVGERCGNANLCSIIPALKLKMNRECLEFPENLPQLTQLSRFFCDIAVMQEQSFQPYVGSKAFAHKGGTHVNAVQKNVHTFEHIDPDAVGNNRKILLSDQAGLTNVILKAREQKIDLQAGRDDARKILDELKRREAQGYAFEAADASFKLLVEKCLRQHHSPFSLDGFRVIVEKRGPEEKCLSEATIKVNVNGRTEITAAEGEGPVNALDLALRKALSSFFPAVRDMHLQDFKVRILDGNQATAASTRVLIESSNGKNNWNTVGVSENIIEAAWQALLDSIEFFLEKQYGGSPEKTDEN